MAERIGFISTRFSGTDGVSLESAKWAQVLWDYGHISYWYAGELDRAEDVSLCIPEAHFKHPENLWINERVWGRETRDALVNRRILDMAAYLKSSLYAFMQKFEISIFVIENCLSIPMHLPLGIAITEFLSETGMPSIAHHHDFYWERTRFSVSSVPGWLDMAFPPRTPGMRHVVINLAALEELAWRKGLTSLLIPNVLDFENPPPPPDAYASSVREDIGLAPGDVMILQPTRVVPRKGIEHAIKLVGMLGDPKYKLVISHKAGDEGMEYCQMLAEMAREEGVDLRFVETRVGDSRQFDPQGKKIYTLWDLYSHADLITYPSLYEGFGNAFLEAIYFRKPVLINRYAIFGRDVEPKGFRVPVMDGYLTKGVVRELRKILEDAEYRRQMVDHNYQVATRFYSYSVLRRSLRTLITDIRGLD
ncbi:MAG TPA: glycosyltransferase family 4 protein [Kiritimatiellia bacterium]|nr:glycosyltransferase family 4 protein [Kiritimatiellia bacterium]